MVVHISPLVVQEDGVFQRILVPEGQRVPVGTPVVGAPFWKGTSAVALDRLPPRYIDTEAIPPFTE